MFKAYKKLKERIKSLEDELGYSYEGDGWHNESMTERGTPFRLKRLEDKVFPRDDKEKSRFDK